LQGVTPQNLRGVSGRAYIPKLGVFLDIATTSAHHLPHYYSTSYALAMELSQSTSIEDRMSGLFATDPLIFITKKEYSVWTGL